MIHIKALQYPINANIELPGSKSISNRLLMLRAILKLDVRFRNLSDAEDTITLAKALGKIQSTKSATIDIEHAGTDMRFLTTYLSVTEGEWILTGSERMKQRPIFELVDGLRKLGAEISYLELEGFPPLKIKGKKLSGGKIEIDGGISSQFISALLLIAPTFENGIELKLTGEIVSWPYIQMTIELLKQFGASINVEKNIITFKNSEFDAPNSTFPIESDWSCASYYYSVMALAKDSEIILTQFSKESLQADSVLPQIYDALGVKTEFIRSGIKLAKQEKKITEFNYDFTNCPDIAQTLAVTCLGLGIKANLTGLKTLKIKETDRIIALKNELEKFGAEVFITNDSIKIIPKPSLPISKIHIQTYNDHRMAMSFAPLVLKCGELKIENPDVVNKSYPAFWEDLLFVGVEIL